MPRLPRIPFRSVIAVLLLVPSWSGQTRLALLGRHAQIEAAPVALYPDEPGRKRLGGLVFERGYRLTSRDRSFGGFSALAVDGDRFTLLSDGGNIVRFNLDDRGRLHHISFAELPDGPGTGWQKLDRDSESMTRDPATGQIWVGFERANAIWRFTPDLAAARGHAEPAAMAGWAVNGGPEALLRLADGRFIALSEEVPEGRRKAVRRSGIRDGLMFAGDPVAAPGRGFRFGYRPPSGFSPTDMVALPNGRLLILNRRFALPWGFTAAVTSVPLRAIARGRIITGQVVARFAPPVLRDNFEGLALVRDKGGLALWIVSDDNQSVFQQTLLLKFRLAPAPEVAPTGRKPGAPTSGHAR